LADWIFWGNVRRRGTDVNIPKIGSRVGQLCFGGIQRFYAELRREINWGNWGLGFFGVFLVSPREAIEEGTTWCALLCIWEGIYCVNWVGLIVWGLLGLPMGCVRVRGLLDNGVEERGGFSTIQCVRGVGVP
jgi:hypothetical protein